MEGRIEGAPFINLIQQMQMWFTGADVSATAVMSENAKGFDKTVTMRDDFIKLSICKPIM